ncbi:uncharacterized protein LOC124705823 isoform X2 [Lolium rigidum]|uniref:uncharacterized protein LOC124705823 isoform X2 n=1 Tax=Lolium rigidum TaxID=89674 RepID=UPI001F5C1A96|nr:uncharacterized protein LOC124705823 isoform X2 [Lolium rigidum]
MEGLYREIDADEASPTSISSSWSAWRRRSAGLLAASSSNHLRKLPPSTRCRAAAAAPAGGRHNHLLQPMASPTSCCSQCQARCPQAHRGNLAATFRSSSTSASIGQ